MMNGSWPSAALLPFIGCAANAQYYSCNEQEATGLRYLSRGDTAQRHEVTHDGFDIVFSSYYEPLARLDESPNGVCIVIHLKKGPRALFCIQPDATRMAQWHASAPTEASRTHSTSGDPGKSVRAIMDIPKNPSWRLDKLHRVYTLYFTQCTREENLRSANRHFVFTDQS